jgi:hypothetical protein
VTPSIDKKYPYDSFPSATTNLLISRFKNGAKFEGCFVKDLENGFGIITYPPGESHQKFEGNWKDGKKFGEGMLHFNDGTTCMGNFYNNSLQGYCVIKFSKERSTFARYEGFLKDGRFNGYGTMYAKDGSKYEGEWENARMHGFGIRTFSNSSLYTRYQGYHKVNNKYLFTWRMGKCRRMNLPILHLRSELNLATK